MWLMLLKLKCCAACKITHTSLQWNSTCDFRVAPMSYWLKLEVLCCVRHSTASLHRWCLAWRFCLCCFTCHWMKLIKSLSPVVVLVSVSINWFPLISTLSPLQFYLLPSLGSSTLKSINSIPRVWSNWCDDTKMARRDEKTTAAWRLSLFLCRCQVAQRPLTLRCFFQTLVEHHQVTSRWTEWRLYTSSADH